jgi:hypothetical protein
MHYILYTYIHIYTIHHRTYPSCYAMLCKSHTIPYHTKYPPYIQPLPHNPPFFFPFSPNPTPVTPAPGSGDGGELKIQIIIRLSNSLKQPWSTPPPHRAPTPNPDPNGVESQPPNRETRVPSPLCTYHAHYPRYLRCCSWCCLESAVLEY